MFTEIVAEAKDNKLELYITLLDTAKAFDVVSHHSLLNALYQQGVQDNVWQLFNSLYSDIHSSVKWNGTMSQSFQEKQGIRQGGASSADCYKAGKNQLLKTLDQKPSLRIGHLHVGAIMVADDLALLSIKPSEMQIALNVAELDASRERYEYNTDKTKVITMNMKNPSSALMLNSDTLGTSNKEAHLGILRNNKGSNVDTLNDRVTKARRAAYSLMGAGFHGMNGVGPEVAAIQYATYIIPTLLYGLEALVIEENELQTIEKYHRRTLRYIQHLPMSTANAAVHLLLGVPPAEALLHIKVLLTFRDIVDDENTAAPTVHIREIITRQIAIKDTENSSWTSYVKRLLRKYKLPNAYKILETTPKKETWKRQVKEAVNSTWTEALIEEGEGKTTLKYLSLPNCNLGTLHPVWQNLDNPLDIQKATVQARLLTQRYPLAPTFNHDARRGTSPQCKEKIETTLHFLLLYPALAEIQ